MTLTPVEIRHLKPARSIVGGYKRIAVDALMDEIVASFEDVWRERADLADKVEQLEADLIRYRELAPADDSGVGREVRRHAQGAGRARG